MPTHISKKSINSLQFGRESSMGEHQIDENTKNGFGLVFESWMNGLCIRNRAVLDHLRIAWVQHLQRNRCWVESKYFYDLSMVHAKIYTQISTLLFLKRIFRFWVSIAFLPRKFLHSYQRPLSTENPILSPLILPHPSFSKLSYTVPPLSPKTSRALRSNAATIFPATRGAAAWLSAA